MCFYLLLVSGFCLSGRNKEKFVHAACVLCKKGAKTAGIKSPRTYIIACVRLKVQVKFYGSRN